MTEKDWEGLRMMSFLLFSPADLPDEQVEEEEDDNEV